MMRKFTIFIGVQTIAATGLISVFAFFSLPALSQDTSEKTPSSPVESTVSNESDDGEVVEAQSVKAFTIEDPMIPINQLEILLKPLSQKQLIAEVDAWQTLLEEKSREISQKEVKIKRQETQGSIDDNLLVTVTKLQGEQANLIKQVNTVVDALEVKGGDVSSYRQYLDAVSGLEFSFKNTEGLGVRFTTWLLAPDGGISVLISLAKFGGVLIVTVILAPRLTKLAEKALMRVSGMSLLFREFVVTIVKRGIYVVGGLIALAALGFDLGPILAVVGGASFILAFALQSNLGNFASGLMLLISKPFDVGDEVKVAGYWAYVDSISLANTKLKDFGGNIITLPNNTVWGGDLINYTHDEKRKVSIGINVKFSQDIEEVQDLWFSITSSNPKVLTDPKPSIFPWNSTYDYYIYIGLTAWTQTDGYWDVYVELLKTLQKRLEEVGIELAAPLQEIKLNESAVNTLESQRPVLNQAHSSEKPVV